MKATTKKSTNKACPLGKKPYRTKELALASAAGDHRVKAARCGRCRQWHVQ